jgi:hypothetical protein
MRDRRWDFLYDRQKQPIKELILDRFAEQLVKDLCVWPPPLEWMSEELARRYAPGLDAPPTESGIRFAFEIARLDLARDFEAVDRLMTNQADERWPGPAGTAAGQLLVRFVTESCLALKEHAEAARITRSDLARVLEEVEKRLFTAPGLD